MPEYDITLELAKLHFDLGKIWEGSGRKNDMHNGKVCNY